MSGFSRQTTRLAGIAPIRLIMSIALASACGGGSIAVLAQDSRPPDGAKALETAFGDFLHFARMGKFTEAQAAAQKVLEFPGLRPIDLLGVADKDPESVPTLITLIKNTALSESAQRVLGVIRDGEFERRQDPERIRQNIAALAGPPQAEFSAIQRLKESGEYAAPALVAALLDPAQQNLWPRIIRVLPQFGKPVVQPLAVALAVEDPSIREQLVWALGEIGYPQAAPYLLELAKDAGQRDNVREAALVALQRIGEISDRHNVGSPVTAFVRLAEQYYAAAGPTEPDPRAPAPRTANIWRWDNGRLRAIPVPMDAYGPIMAMDCLERAIRLEPNCREAIGLWLAANVRREARLGMDVESGQADAGADADATRPKDFPRSVYFSQAAGPEYSHLVLARAVADVDKPVALGALAALSVVAGESSLIGVEEYKQSLVRALQFPDAEVRIKAAVALTRARPKTAFPGADQVAPVLAEALCLRSRPQYVVADADQQNANRLAGELRSAGAEVVAETTFYAAMDRARRELPNVSGFFLSTDLDTPGLTRAAGELRKEFRFARAPLIVLVKPQQEQRAEQALAAVNIADRVDALAGAADLQAAMAKLTKSVAGEPMPRAEAVKLALAAVDAVRLAAIDGRTAIDIGPTIPALVADLSEPEEELRIKAAQVLALTSSPEAQQSIAKLALTKDNSEPLRLAAFDALAESARRHGNLLVPDQITEVVQVAADEPNLIMRTSASQALGALNLQVNEASAIIRKYAGG